MQRKIKVFLVEDDQAWVEGLRWLLEKEQDLVLVGTASTKDDAISIVKLNLEVDVVLLDIMLGRGVSGIELIPEFKGAWPQVKVVMLTSLDNGKTVMECIAAGATDYVQKASYEDLPEVIRDAYNGDAVLHRSAAIAIKSELTQAGYEAKRSLLTKQERHILALVHHGKTVGQIQKELGIESHTVYNYINRTNRKLGTKTRTEAAEKAKVLGLLDEFLEETV